MSRRDVYTVGELNREVRELLATSFPLLWVEGEISNLARPRSGHLYLTLKDADAQVRCAMFRSRNLLLDFQPRDGMHVLVRARVGLYEARGEYQLTIEHMEEAGSGALYRAFEALKKRLTAEGLFETDHKLPLPPFPRRVGIITSPTGAAIRDILSVLHRRFPALEVLIYPVPVQGNGAAERIAAAVRQADRQQACDVLILTRGGGSLEDLWPFNEETVARAIHECALPVVSGIGHETDFTIADFVADLRAPTPSAAAELVCPDRTELAGFVMALRSRLHGALAGRIDALSRRFAWLQGRLRLQHPEQRLQQQLMRLDDLEQRLSRAMRYLLHGHQEHVRRLGTRLGARSPHARLQVVTTRLQHLHSRLDRAMGLLLDRLATRLATVTQTLNAVGPQATLERGYAIVTSHGQGRLVRSHADIGADHRVSIRLAAERLDAEVTGWTEAAPPPDGDGEEV